MSIERFVTEDFGLALLFDKFRYDPSLLFFSISKYMTINIHNKGVYDNYWIVKMSFLLRSFIILCISGAFYLVSNVEYKKKLLEGCPYLNFYLKVNFSFFPKA
jgi:hypothetical protein